MPAFVIFNMSYIIMAFTLKKYALRKSAKDPGNRPCGK